MQRSLQFAVCSLLVFGTTISSMGQQNRQIYNGQSIGNQPRQVQQAYPNNGNFQPQFSPQYSAQNLSPAAMQHWTQQLAQGQRQHDFGVVPSYSNQEFVFEFVNVLDVPIYLTSVRASCGCTKPSILTSAVVPGETGRVLAKFDTKNFKGTKKATITVTTRRDQPYTQIGEIQFNVTGTIRRDVVLNPGTVSFDDITFGENTKRSVQILYAGNPQWRIDNVKSTNSNISIETKEIQRNAQNHRVDYELILTLNEKQKIGSFVDQILITTNDVSNKNLTVNLQGNVKSIVQVSPVRLGVIAKDQQIEKRLIVRGARPFGIKSVSAGDDRIHFSPSEGAKTLHILTYRLDTSIVGQISSKITIETDDPNQEMATVPFEAQVVPATFALDSKQPVPE